MAKAASGEDQAGKIARLEGDLQEQRDFVRIRAKYGSSISDEQARGYLDQERGRAATIEARHERERAEQERAERERRTIATSELGHRILVDLNGTRIPDLSPAGAVLCPSCGTVLPAASTMVGQAADLIRSCGTNLRSLIAPTRGGVAREGAPVFHEGESCPHCGLGAETTVQLIII